MTIEGALDGGFPAATSIGPGSGVGLKLAGSANVRNLILGNQGFGVGVVARQGTKTFSYFLLATASGRQAVIDGQTFSTGILARGTACTTLDAGSSLFVNGATGVGVRQQARFTRPGAEVRLAGSANNGVFVGDQGQLTMDATGQPTRCSPSSRRSDYAEDRPESGPHGLAHDGHVGIGRESA